MANDHNLAGVHDPYDQCIPQLPHSFHVRRVKARVRFFNMFRIDLSKEISLREVLYILAIVAASYGIYVSNLNLITIFAFNGAVIGYTYVFIIPIWIHLKCIWFDRSCG